MFSHFSHSLYNTVDERTKGHDNNKKKRSYLENLPLDFKENNKFLKVVNLMRHSLGGVHLTQKFMPQPNQLSKPAMLERLSGTKNEPNTPDEFHKLQIETLKMFESELERLSTLVRAMT